MAREIGVAWLRLAFALGLLGLYALSAYFQPPPRGHRVGTLPYEIGARP